MIITLRRAAAVVLALVFLAAFLAALALSRANATAADPDFYAERLRNGDVYNFIYDDLAPAAIKEGRQEIDKPVIDFAKLEKEIVGAARAMFPPDWLQQQAEASLEEFVPYVAGESDSFSIKIRVDQQLGEAGPGIKKAVLTGRIGPVLYEGVVTDTINSALQGGKVPFGLPFTTAELVGAIQRMAPPDWIDAQIGKGIDAIVPYLAGDKDAFEIIIRPSERAEAANTELKRLAASKDLTPFVIGQIIDPALRGAIGPGIALPFGVTVTPKDIEDALRTPQLQPWLQARITDLAGTTVDFMTLRSGTVSLTVPLRPTAGDAAAALIVSREPRLAGSQAEISRQVNNALPNALVFGEAELRRAMGEAQWAQISDVRRWFRDGFAFTQDTLEEQLAQTDYHGQLGRPWDQLDAAAKKRFIATSETVDKLHQARGRMRGGFTYTDKEFLKDLRNQGGEQAVRDFQDGRSDIHKVLRWRTVAWVLAIVLLVVIGLLGGRTRRSKLAWAAAVLFISSLVTFVVVTGVWNNQVEDRIDDRFEEQLREPGKTALERTFLERARAVSLDAADDIESGLRRQTLVLWVVSGIVLAGAVAWPRIRGGAPGGGGEKAP